MNLITLEQLAALIRRIDEYTPCEHLTCRSGLTLSVQGSRSNYSSPRQANARVYSHVEVGYPSETVPELMEYIESSYCSVRDEFIPGDPTQSVYPWVPAELVCRVIASRGGLASVVRPEERQGSVWQREREQAEQATAAELEATALADSVARFGELELD